MLFARQIDGIPCVVNDAQRDALFPTPATNQRVYNTSATTIERYNGSSWVVEFTGITAQAAAITAAVLASLPAITSLDTPSTLVERDPSGNFAAGVVSAALAGNATTATSATTAGTVTTAAQPAITSLGTLTGVTLSGPEVNAAGETAQQSGNVRTGGITQVSGSSAGFNIFTPAGQGNYQLVISGKNAADPGAPTLAFVDVVVLVGAVGWAPVVVSSSNTVGSPGARTYTNNVASLKVATAGGPVTWYVDIAITRFAS